MTCDSYISPKGNVLLTSGIYSDTLMNQSGCDSIIHINLIIVQSPLDSVIQNDFTLTALDDSVSYQWVRCDSNYQTISGQTSKSLQVSENGSYAVILNRNGCTDTSECFVYKGIGIEEIGVDKTILVYPNPCKDYVYLEFESNSEVNIKLYDQNAQLVKNWPTFKASKAKLEFSKFLSDGLYYLMIENEHRISTKKIQILSH